MEIKKVEQLVLNAPFEKQTTRSLIVNPLFSVNYTPVRVRNYNAEFLSSGNNVTLHFGCQKVSKTDLEGAIRSLKGEKLLKTFKAIIGKGKKDSTYVKSDFIEESENYIIAKGNRAFPKTTHEIREVTINIDVLKTDYRDIQFRGYDVARKDDKESQRKLATYLQYLLDVWNKIEEIQTTPKQAA